MKLLNKLRITIFFCSQILLGLSCKNQFYYTDYGGVRLYRNNTFEGRFLMGLAPKVRGSWIKKNDTILLTSEYQPDSINNAIFKNSNFNINDSCYINREQMPTLTNLIFFASNSIDTMYYCCPRSFNIVKNKFDSIQIVIANAKSKKYSINLTDTL